MEDRARALGILIVGGNGLLGSHLARSLRQRARVTVTYAKNRVPLEGVLSVQMDVKDVTGIRKLTQAQRPDVVLYLGGPEDSTWAEKNQKAAEKIFAAGPAEALHAAELYSARFLYISSASVFDGTRGNYSELDSISPTSLLGKFKASGEAVVRGRSNTASILRLSRLVGSAHPWRPSLFDQVRIALETEQKIELRNDEYHSWAPVSEAVKAIEAIVDQAPRSALYHYGGLTRLTPFEMGRFFAKALGYSATAAESSIGEKKRVLQKGMVILREGEKYDFSLNSTAIIRALGVRAVPIEDAVRREFEF